MGNWRRAGAQTVLLCAAFGVLCSGCKKGPPEITSRGSSGPGATRGLAPPLPQPAPAPGARDELPPDDPPAAPDPEAIGSPASPQRPLSERWHIGPVADVGPAAPMAATPAGVVLISKDNQVYLARRDGPDGFVSTDAPGERFSRYGRGPAVTPTFAYWVSATGHLMQGLLAGGEPRELDRDVRFGARVSALSTQGRELLAYIKGAGDETTAHLWASRGPGGEEERKTLSPEGSTATSVTLVPGSPHPRAIVLEGRSGMSPVHTRVVRVTPRRVTLDVDQVVWVGPGSHPLTELVSLDQRAGGATALLASARDITHFGLAQIPIKASAEEIHDPIWHAYPNGLDPAPVAAAHLCKADFALFAIPSGAEPRAPQELRIAEMKPGGFAQEEVLARSRAFNDVSVAPLPGGALLSWTADRRTWALILGCPN